MIEVLNLQERLAGVGGRETRQVGRNRAEGETAGSEPLTQADLQSSFSLNIHSQATSGNTEGICM